MSSTPSARTIPYFGGKMRLAPWIASHVGTTHHYYVEPFAGSASVLVNLPRSNAESINDLDGDVMNFWRVLRDQEDELVRALQATPYGREELRIACSKEDDLSSVERARRFVVRSCMSFSAKHSGGFSASSPRKGSRKGAPVRFARLVDQRLPALADRMRRVELENVDALQFLARWNDPRTTTYVDPPYLGETRNTSRAYTVDAEGQEFHSRLLEYLNAFRGRVVLSGYVSEQYADLLPSPKWVLHERNVSAASAAKRQGDIRRTECIWVKGTEDG